MAAELTRRQKHVLVALLDLERERGDRYHRLIIAGDVARRLGFRSGPRQLGNGAKDGRSFSGYGSLGKWVAFTLVALERRGLVERWARCGRRRG